MTLHYKGYLIIWNTKLIAWSIHHSAGVSYARSLKNCTVAIDAGVFEHA